MDPADPPPPSPYPATAADSPLECNLAHRTLALLDRLGLATTAGTAAPASLINPHAPATHLAWTPLVPLADLSSLAHLITHDARATAPRLEQLASTPSTLAKTSEARTRTLDTLARLALRQPALTVEVLAIYRPLAAVLVGRWFDLLGLTDSGSWRASEPGQEAAPGERDAVDKVWSALVRALPLLGDDAMPCVLSPTLSVLVLLERARPDPTPPRQVPAPPPAPPPPRPRPAPPRTRFARVRLAPRGSAPPALLGPAPPAVVPGHQRLVAPAADRADHEDAPAPRHAPRRLARPARLARPLRRHRR